ncbi:MAG: O-acetyl-ADP-ribose deacetylase [Chitinivibrionales bacterium]|nr:O-acetyl-ADP-ribose deacetylase [Chitinivibrionales bacterium]
MRISIHCGDITRIACDAIVNAANSSLMGGGGVDGAIHRAGGPQILRECRDIVAHRGKCPAGEAVITTAGKLPARHVIHTVGPVWRGGNHGEADLLSQCYVNCLKLAVACKCGSVAFPAISTGVYGYPPDDAAVVAFSAVTSFGRDDVLDEVVFVFFKQSDLDTFHRVNGPAHVADNKRSRG